MATLSTFFDMVYVYATESSGHGPFTLGGAVTGFQTAASAGITNGTSVSYRATDGTHWETAHGVVDVSGSVYTLTRGVDTIKSSNSNSLVNFGSGVTVAITELSQDLNLLLSAGAAQSFTSVQRAQAKSNLGVGSLCLEAYMGSSQNLSGAGYSVMAVNTVTIDTQSGFNTSTYRYTPNIAGLYLFFGICNIGGGPSTDQFGIILYKNSTVVEAWQFNAGLSGASLVCLVQMNGTTDYVSLSVYSQASSGITAFATNPSFTGVLL